MIDEKIRPEILEAIAPCSMVCNSCSACIYNRLQEESDRLLDELKDHKNNLNKNIKKEFKTKLREFKLFNKELKKYTNIKCPGCRQGRNASCSQKDCLIPKCTKIHNVNFCSECEEFPCDKVNENIYPEEKIKNWLSGNKKIKEQGIIQYYEQNVK